MKIKHIKVDIKTPLEEQLKELAVANCLNLLEWTHTHLEKEIFDVEDGEEMMGKSPNECMKDFEQHGRRGLTIYEGLALLRENPDILKQRNIILCDSRRGGGGVANLLLYEGRTGLGWLWASRSVAGWGSASCGKLNLESRNLDSLESRILSLEEFRKKVEQVLKL